MGFFSVALSKAAVVRTDVADRYHDGDLPFGLTAPLLRLNRKPTPGEECGIIGDVFKIEQPASPPPLYSASFLMTHQ